MKKTLLILAVLIVGPLSVSAVTFTPGQVQTATNFCSNISSVVSGVNQFMSRSEVAVQAQRKLIQTQLKATQDKVNSQLQTTRAAWEEQMVAKLNSLETSGKVTAEQKQAIATFKATLTSAKTTKNSAIKAANEAFRAELKKVIDSRSAEIDAAIKTLSSSAKVAGDAAIASCNSGTSPTTVRQSLTNSLKAAQQQFLATRKAIDLKSSAQPYAQTKTQAIKAANDQFKATMKTALDQLKLAFPQQ